MEGNVYHSQLRERSPPPPLADFRDYAILVRSQTTPFVLLVPELLENVLSWLPRADLARAARVSRTWCKYALEFLWRKIPHYWCLFNLYSPLRAHRTTSNPVRQVIVKYRARPSTNQSLSPMNRQATTFWGFRDVSQEGGRWDVLESYARRVREIEACTEVYSRELYDHMFAKIGDPSEHPTLLPNLRTLSLSVTSDAYNPVEELWIAPPTLRVLRMHIGEGVRSTRVQDILENFASVPLNSLTRVEFSTPLNRPRTTFPEDLSIARAWFLGTARETLVELDVAVFPMERREVQEMGVFPVLKRVRMMQRGTYLDLEGFFGAIGSSFPSLQSLHLTLDGAIKEEVSVALAKGMKCRDLRKFHVDCRWWKRVTEEDVIHFGEQWPLLEEFCLYQFYYASEDATPFAMLEVFARVWGKTLREIVLRFDTSVPLPDISSIGFRFDRLDTLFVGQTDLDKDGIEEVAKFLVTICHPGSLDIVSLVGNGESFYRWGLVQDRRWRLLRALALDK
ncbi:hypothetical protein FRB90_004878 [Tulasnella sp. 427]|nr:hypothetical protein FRB90_004878 [Tulasnella sp. 427]